MPLAGKKIVIGVTGSIAAYKTCEIVSLLKQAGADIHIIMTEAAAKFVTPLTFHTISGNPVRTGIFSDPSSSEPLPHITLGRADLFLIAPATANILAKAAYGVADDLISTTILSSDGPVMFVPAMNVRMWQSSQVRENVKKLKSIGYHFIGPAEGRLACGEAGEGRMSEPDEIVAAVMKLLVPEPDLKGIKVLVTAGPTREALDPVRFISNRSSGKMGYAVAEAALRRGAEVVLISGPTRLTSPPGVRCIAIETAEELFHAVQEEFNRSDILVMAAAVADFRPARLEVEKIKHRGAVALPLVPNPDILKAISAVKKDQIVVGFAVDTLAPSENARRKLVEKGLDFIVRSDITAAGSGFDREELSGAIIDRVKEVNFSLLPKKTLAAKILDRAKASYDDRLPASRLWREAKQAGVRVKLEGSYRA
ncbi:MAG: bifunctional phosphopantothenoylcysteine decarboxylase/phosphopantothenate--cysteine ligase CoaBC [Candidatus Margulisiibacteriota bacterium]